MSDTRLQDRLRAALAARYALIGEIAVGGQGRVFRARDLRLGRDVALKVLRPELATAAAASRFLAEAQVLARLKHPNVVTIHDTGEADGLPFYVMDLADDETLALRLRAGALSPAETISLARDLAAGLAAVHRARVVHRDVKPSNIFLQDGRAVLGDFGIAHLDPAEADRSVATDPGGIIGTPDYMAPEQLAGAPATPASDVYAAGAVIYEAATGRRWRGLGPQAGADWAGVPSSLVPPLRRALDLAPAARWRDGSEFARALASPAGRRALRRTLLGGVIIGVGVVAWMAGRGGAPVARVTGMADLAVLPFGRDPLGRELGSFVASTLEWSPRWSLRPYREVLGWWDSAGQGAEVIAKDRVRARHWVDGRIEGSAGRDTLILRIQGVQGAGGIFRVPRDAADIAGWARNAADSIVQHVAPDRAPEFRELLAGSSGDYEANRLLIAGMDAFELDDWDASRRLLRQALARDPRLDRALFELDLLHRWQRRPLDPDLVPLVAAAASRMPPPYGTLMRSEQELDLARRLGSLRAATDAYPGNARARFVLLNEAFHRAPLTGMPLAEALGWIEEGIASTPYLDHVAMYDHLVWGYIHLGDRPAAEAAFDRRAALARGRRDPFGPLLRLAYQARFQPLLGRGRGWVAAQTYRDDPDLARFLRFGLTFDVPGLQRQLAAGLRQAQDPAVRTSAMMAEGLALLQLGRVAEGLALVDAATARMATPEARLQSLGWRIIPASLGLPFTDSMARDAARTQLALLAGAGGATSREAAWIQAIDALERDDVALFERIRAGPALADTATQGARYLATILRGLALARDGRLDSALAVTDHAIIDDSSGAIGSAFARSVLHIRRGQWRQSLGRGEAADRSWLYHENSHLRGWPDGIAQAGEVDAVLSVHVRHLRAELAFARGDTLAGCRHARRVRELWADADPPLRARAARVAAPCR